MLALFAAAVAVGLVLLARASDALVVGCSTVASRWGVPPLVVGVVVIGFGTSSPELLVSGLAAGSGTPELGVGTVIGSNIANLTLVLGAAALVAPIAVRAAVVRREAPLSFLACVAFAIAVRAGMTRPAGTVLLVVLALALVLLLRWTLSDVRAAALVREPGGAGGGGSEPLASDVEEMLAASGPASSTRGVLLVAVAGLVGTLVGAQSLVWGAVGLAKAVGLPSGFIGATVVAVGTSLPELVTAAQAARRGETDLIVGNLLGSNLFNALAVGGVVAVVSGGAAVSSGLASVGLVVMLAVSALATGFMWRKLVVLRWEAAVLMAAYVATIPLLAT